MEGALKTEQNKDEEVRKSFDVLCEHTHTHTYTQVGMGKGVNLII